MQHEVRWEVCPAAAAGLPVVTTDAGGSAEIVEDGISGRVVPRGDAQALAGALAAVLPIPRAR